MAGAMADVTEKLAAFAGDLKYEDLPAEVIERTKVLLLDITGIMVRARHDAEHGGVHGGRQADRGSQLPPFGDEQSARLEPLCLP